MAVGRNEDAADAAGTLIGAGALFEGTLETERDLSVDGMLRGARVKTQGVLVVGPEGRVEAADIEVGEATIRGRLSGRLSARRCVRIEAGAHVSGAVITPRLVLHEGAICRADKSA